MNKLEVLRERYETLNKEYHEVSHSFKESGSRYNELTELCYRIDRLERLYKVRDWLTSQFRRFNK